MPSNEYIPRKHWPEAIETAKTCGCICHFAEVRHFISCCDATYFRVDLAEKIIASEAVAIGCSWCRVKAGEPCVDIQLGRWVAGYHFDRVADALNK